MKNSMTNSQRFVEAAVRGGWHKDIGLSIADRKYICNVLLSADAWRAVGREMGWVGKCYICNKTEKEGHTVFCSRQCNNDRYDIGSWLNNLHDFIDHLAQGKSVDSALGEVMGG